MQADAPKVVAWKEKVDRRRDEPPGCLQPYLMTIIAKLIQNKFGTEYIVD
jgi:hypothetical protein